MDIIGIQTQLATILTGVGGVAQTFAQQPSVMNKTPSLVVGQPHGKTATGSPQVTAVTVPVRVYVARIADEARAAAIVTPLVNAVIAALAPYNANAGYWNVVETVEWDTCKYYEVAGASYIAVDFEIGLIVIDTVGTYGAH